MAKKMTHEEFEKKVFEKLGNYVTLLSGYINKDTKIKVRCNNCGRIREVKPETLLKNGRGGKCAKCSHEDRYTHKTTHQFEQEVCNVLGKPITILGKYINRNTKVKVRCNICNTIWEALPDTLLSKNKSTGCPTCCKSKKFSQDKFERTVHENLGDKVSIIGEYINRDTKVKAKCNICNTVWEANPRTLMKGQGGCPKCSKTVKITQEEYEKRLFEIHNGNIFTLESYKNKRTKIRVKCNICKYEWRVIPETLTRGFGCPKCSGNAKKTLGEFIKEVYNLVGDEYTVLGEYKSRHSNVLLKHNTCGNTFEMTPGSFLQGQRCPHERYKKSALKNSITQGRPDEKKRLLQSICEKEGYQIIKGYVNEKEKLVLKHSECGDVYEVLPYSFIITGIRCPCKRRSKGEEIIREWLKENNFIFEEQYKISECKNIRPLPFDFAVFNINKLLFLIEFDGLQHYMKKFTCSDGETNTRNFERTKQNDKIKDRFCKENNIHLIRIKYNRCTIYEKFKERIIDELKEKINNLNKTIPSEANEETLRTCND